MDVSQWNYRFQITSLHLGVTDLGYLKSSTLDLRQSVSVLLFAVRVTSLGFRSPFLSNYRYQIFVTNQTLKSVSVV